MNKAKPEAAYFFEAGGDRVAAFIVDMQTPDQIPVLAEPLFVGWGAKVEFHPAMNFNDLKKAISQIRGQRLKLAIDKPTKLGELFIPLLVL